MNISLKRTGNVRDIEFFPQRDKEPRNRTFTARQRFVSKRDSSFLFLFIYIYIQTLLFYDKYFDEFEFLANEEEEEDLKSVYIIRSRNDDVNRIVF